MTDIVERRGKRKLSCRASELASLSPKIQQRISAHGTTLLSYQRPAAPEATRPPTPTLRASRVKAATLAPTELGTLAGEPIAHKRGQYLSWTLPLGAGMLLVMGVLLIWVWMIVPLWGSLSRQWNYGTSRTSTFTAHVGHQDQEKPTLFLGTVLDHHLQVIELPGGNPQAVQVYPIAQVAPGVDAVMSFATRDVNGDGRLDLLITIETNTTLVSVLYNDGKRFHTSEPLSDASEGGKP